MSFYYFLLLSFLCWSIFSLLIFPKQTPLLKPTASGFSTSLPSLKFSSTNIQTGWHQVHMATTRSQHQLLDCPIPNSMRQNWNMFLSSRIKHFTEKSYLVEQPESHCATFQECISNYTLPSLGEVIFSNSKHLLPRHYLQPPLLHKPPT